jgi:flagellar assembly factor FliW
VKCDLVIKCKEIETKKVDFPMVNPFSVCNAWEPRPAKRIQIPNKEFERFPFVTGGPNE